MTETATDWRWPIRQPHRTVGEAGPLVFVGGAGDFDGKGRIAHPGDLGAQIEGSIRNLQAALALRSCGLADVLRLKVFYRSDGAGDEWELLAALSGKFEDEPAPAITLHPVPLQPFAGQEIQVQAIANKGWRNRPNIQTVLRKPPERVAPLFERPAITRGLRAGEFIVVPAQTAIDDQDVVLAPESGIEQTRIVMTRIEDTLKELGAGLQDAVKKEGYYFGTRLEDWAGMAGVRATYFRDPGPVATVVPCHALYPKGTLTKVEVFAMRTEKNKYIPREDRWPERVWDWPIPVPYRQGIALRDMIWVGGQVPFEAGGNSWRPVHVGDLLAQTRFTMAYVSDIVTAFGRSSVDYRLLVCYFTSGGTPEETEAFIDAIAGCVEGDLPPMTVVPQPHMHSPEVGVEIWAVASLS